jgi:putative flippase GtrA
MAPSRLERLIAAWHERLSLAMSFALVGVVNSAVDFGVFAIAYSYFDLPIILANVLSWCVAVSGSYVMNSLTTFAHESGRELRAKAYFSFALSQAAGLVANTTTVVSRPISCRCWTQGAAIAFPDTSTSRFALHRVPQKA